MWNTEQGFCSKVAKTWKHCQGKPGTHISLCLQIIVIAFLEEMIQKSDQVPEGNMYDTWKVSLDELIILSIFKTYKIISLLKSKS